MTIHAAASIMLEQRWFVRIVRLVLPAIVAAGVLAPQSAFAQQSESWNGMSYRLSDSQNVAVIGGLRVFTVAAQVEFNTAGVSATPIDASRSAVSVFGGLTYRPALSEKVTLVSRADIGGGSGMSWAAESGLEFPPAPWAGLVLGYRAIGVSLGTETDDHDIRKPDLTFYGPVFGPCSG